ncbi:hypothetical protein [Shewanella sediminis]|uniref:hypothetical protein n=1 Tax=Shewanella sediminis TaxID=271097 RepID=UPI0002EE7F0E|nr:hypothetical protein [Shewanella sediminis]
MAISMKNAVLLALLLGISACSNLKFAPIDVHVEPEAKGELPDSRADPMAGNNERIVNEARQDGRLERN